MYCVPRIVDIDITYNHGNDGSVHLFGQEGGDRGTILYRFNFNTGDTITNILNLFDGSINYPSLDFINRAENYLDAQ